MYIMGFIVWLTLGLVAGFAMYAGYRGPQTTQVMTLVFGVFGAFIGGMLGTAGYVFHDPSPLRFGGLLGALLGAFGFTLIYHFIAKKAI